MQHKGIGVAAQFGNDEGHPLSHQTGDKGHIAGKPVQLGDNYAAFRSFCCSQGNGELGTPFERIRSLASFEFNELGGEH